MARESPVAGRGVPGFAADYMQYQGEYFRNEDSDLCPSGNGGHVLYVVCARGEFFWVQGNKKMLFCAREVFFGAQGHK